MFCILDDIGVVEITLNTKGDSPIICVRGFEGDFWKELLPRILKSSDKDAPQVVSELMFWLEANGVEYGTESVTTAVRGDNTHNSSTDSSGNNEVDTNSMTAIEKFERSLREFKKAQGVRMLQLMAGSTPILVHKAVPDTYCFSFPPETMVYTIDDVKEMARTGRYTFGKRYMDTLLEILDVAR